MNVRRVQLGHQLASPHGPVQQGPDELFLRVDERGMKPVSQRRITAQVGEQAWQGLARRRGRQQGDYALDQDAEILGERALISRSLDRLAMDDEGEYHLRLGGPAAIDGSLGHPRSSGDLLDGHRGIPSFDEQLEYGLRYRRIDGRRTRPATGRRHGLIIRDGPYRKIAALRSGPEHGAASGHDQLVDQRWRWLLAH